MPQPAEQEQVSDTNARRRRLVWVAWTITMVVAAIMYAGKAAEERSAFIRWRHQIHEFWQGANIWDIYHFPNPPIMPILMSPLMALPPVVGALCWFGLKAVMATLCFVWCFRMARGIAGPRWTWWAELLVIVLSLRPILSDLHHGNINILILFLVMATLEAWRRGYDVLAGGALALSIAVKVTPALFVPYFLYKRSWRTSGSAFLGLALFLVIVPSAVLGPSFNGRCMSMWWDRMVTPFVVDGDISPQEVNQSMGGVLTRLLTDVPVRGEDERYGGTIHQANVVSWPPEQVSLLVKGLCFGLAGVLALLCRVPTRDRRDLRLLGEFSLVVLTMLFASERTWKHHYVTLMLPYTYLVYRACLLPLSQRSRAILGGALALSAFLIASTSSDLGGLVFPDSGHDVALALGMFFWGAVVLYIATAWRVHAERLSPPLEVAPLDSSGVPPHHLPPHRAAPSATGSGHNTPLAGHRA